MTRLVMSLAAAAALSATSAMANVYTYGATEDLGPGPDATVALSITTSVDSGVLTSSDILAWNISITDPSGSVDLTNLNSGLLLSGSALTATPTALDFDFNGDGQFLIELGGIGDGGPFWCANSFGQGCFPGADSAPSGELGVATEAGESVIETAPAIGNTPIAFLTSVAPEPGAWALMLTGFAGLGAALRSRRRIVAA